MKAYRWIMLSFLFLAPAFLVPGCTASVESTDDSIRTEAELPKVEVDDQTPDLDVETDDDVDIDTPLSGDE